MIKTTGRGGEIRTPDPLLPKQMRYQAALHPDRSFLGFFNCPVKSKVENSEKKKIKAEQKLHPKSCPYLGGTYFVLFLFQVRNSTPSARSRKGVTHRFSDDYRSLIQGDL